MDDLIIFSQLNDFIFCPISIYFHNLFGDTDTMLFQSSDQINGTDAHSAIEDGRYSRRKQILQAIPVYSEQYGLCGKIDIFDNSKGILTERKKKITTIYDGYVFQLYAQYFALTEMGYAVKHICFHSMDDNKTYPVKLPSEDFKMLAKFERTIKDIQNFDPDTYVQTNPAKCQRCIYEPACDRSVRAT